MVGDEFKRLTTAAVCASLVGFAACSGRNGNGSTSDSATGATSSGEVAKSDSAASATAPASGATAATPGSTATPGTAGGSNLSITGGDAEIVQVLAVVDRGEIQDGQLAERQGRSSQVKSYARELVSDHTKSLSQDRQLAKAVNADLSSVMGTGTSGISGKTGRDTTSKAASPTSAAAGTSGTTGGVAAQLMTMHTQMMDQVKQQKGAAFDSAFVNAEVQGHQQVLDLLQRSQSQAQNPQVQQHLTAAIKDVQDHLQRGQKLQQSLTSGAGMGNDSTMKSKSDTTSKKG
jgi:predicted outer membrane protein